MEFVLGVSVIAVLGVWISIAHLKRRLAEGSEAERNLQSSRIENRRLRELLDAVQMSKEQVENRSKSQLQEKEQQLRAANEQRKALQAEALKTLEETVGEYRKILEEASVGFPWLCRAIAHYETLQDFRRAKYLETKPNPAFKAAHHVREIAARSKEYYTKYEIVRSRLEYYESLFPWLEEYVGLDLETLLTMTSEADKADSQSDPVSKYMAKGEYQSLTASERNQLALDRYRTRRKSPWQIGRDYERYIGYRFESDGYSVDYTGIVEGLADLGRDLIVTKGSDIKIVQCKYWSAHKQIHEKHIAQLFGTTIKFIIDNDKPGSKVTGLFVTSTTLTDMAKAFARHLGIEVWEKVALDEYPLIKCNIGHDEFGFKTRIYHLPMDQQYDRTKVTKRGECYVKTVAEAEQRGFRRAWRWRPEGD